MEAPPFPLSSRPGFPATRHWTRLRVRLSLKERRIKCTQRHEVPQEIRGSEAKGSGVQRTCPGNVFCPLLGHDGYGYRNGVRRQAGVLTAGLIMQASLQSM